MKKKIRIYIVVILMTSILNACSSEKNETNNPTKDWQIIENTILESDLGDKLNNNLFDNQKGIISIESFSENNNNVEFLVDIYWQDSEKKCTKKYRMTYKKNNNQWYNDSIYELECNYKPLKGPNDELIAKNEDVLLKYAKVLENYEPTIDLEKGTATYSYLASYNFHDIVEQQCKVDISYSFSDFGEWELCNERPNIDLESIVSICNFSDFLNIEYKPNTIMSSGYILTINSINIDDKKITATLIAPVYGGSVTHNLSGDFTMDNICGRDEYFYEIDGKIYVKSSLFDENDPSFILEISFSINQSQTVDSINAFISYDYRTDGTYIGNVITFLKE